MTAQLGEYDTFGENGFLHRSPSPVSVAPLSAYLAPPRFSDLTLTLHAFILYRRPYSSLTLLAPLIRHERLHAQHATSCDFIMRLLLPSYHPCQVHLLRHDAIVHLYRTYPYVT